MNWKKLLYFDLSAPLRRKKGSEPEDRDWFDLWFVRLFTGCFHRRRRPANKTPYSPGLYYRMTGKKWKGPFYIVSSRWRRDLLYVLDQLTAIVKTNASLIQGLESCAREERRQGGYGSGRRFMNIVHAYGVAVSCMIAGWVLGFTQLQMFERLDLWAVSYFTGVAALSIIPGIVVRARNGRLEAVFLTLRDDLAKGKPLSEAVRRLRCLFPQFYADLIKAGEDSGRLGECLDQLAQETVHAFSLGRMLRGHLAYLGVVFLIQLQITVFIYLKCMPVFHDILREFGQDSPPLARTIDGILEWFYFTCIKALGFNALSKTTFTQFVLSPLFVQILVVTFFTGGVVYLARRRRFFSTRGLAVVFLFIPWLRGLVIQRNLAVISMVLEKLLKAGVPMDQALEGTAHAELNPLYRRIVERVRRRVLQGESLAEAWQAENRRIARLPGAFLGLMNIGEHSGLLPEALKRLGEFYQRCAEQRTRVLADALLPFGVLCLGFIVLAVELSVFASLVGIIDTQM